MSKIIDRLTDHQLDELYSTYNYQNIIIPEPNSKPYYVVPKLLTLETIIFSDYSQCFNDKDGFIYSGCFCSTRMNQFMGLTTQEYFDLLVLHINDTELRPKCDNPECGSPLHWSGRITAGYGSGGHAWNESDYHFCSRSCAAYYQFNGNEGYEDTKEYIKSGGTFGNMDKSTWTRCHALSRYSQFINLGDINDKCVFYLASTEDDMYKFGISSDMEHRVYCSGMQIPYKTYHILIENTRDYIAKLEYNIKISRNSPEEYFNKIELRDFLKVFKSCKKLTDQELLK